MSRIVISFLLLGILFNSQGQYSQNIDSLSRSEIRRFLLTQDISEKASNSIKNHKTFRTISHVFYGGSGLLLLLSATSNNDLESIIVFAFSGITLGSALLFTVFSEIAYSNAIKKYKSSTQLEKQSMIQIRDSSKIYNFSN